MNVYDFDNTILRGDSTALFVRFAFLHYPKTRLPILRAIAKSPLLCLRKMSLQQWKQELFRLFSAIPNREEAVAQFWDQHLARIESWYLAQKQPSDIIISASPEFLVAEACRRLGIRNVHGSPIDSATGRFTGPNCKGEEKLRLFRKCYGTAQIDAFYSDSRSDTPLARCAKEAYIVRRGKILPWDA